jgi:integrase/recombinase XerD
MASTPNLSLDSFAQMQEWLGHANVAITRIYDHRKTRPEDSPTFKVAY